MPSPKTLKRSLSRSFIAAAMLPIIVISVLVLYDLTGDRARDIDEKNLLLAKAVSGQIEGFLREPQATLHSIGGMLQSHTDMTEAEVQSLLDTIVASSNIFETVYIIDHNGNTRHVGLSPERTELRKDFENISLAHMPFFQQTLQTGESAWSDITFSVISGEMSLALTLPLKDGILVGNFGIRPLTNFVQKLHTNEHIVISVVDRVGTTIAHPDPTFASQQVHIGHLEPVKAALAGKEETLHYMFEQEEYIGSSVLIPGPNWAVLVSQTATNAYRQVRFTGLLFVGGAIGALLLSLLFSLTKASLLAKPISELAEKTDLIAKGQYNIDFTDSGYVEFDTLAGNVRHMASSIHDREEQLTTSRERYRQLVETMNDGLSVNNELGIISYVNPGLSKILGYPMDEIIGSKTIDFLDEENRAIASMKMEERKKGRDSSYELTWIRKNGERVITTVSPKGLFKKGKFIGGFAVISDITARKEAEELVKKSLLDAEEARDKINAILRSVPLGLIVTDMQGRIILMNRSAEKTLGHRFSMIDQKSIDSILTEKSFQDYFSATITNMEDREPIDLELFDHEHQETRTIQISSSRIRSQEDVKTGVIIVLNDVTGERKSDRLKSEFIATAAHELGTPLTAIMGYAELLANQEEVKAFSPEQLQEFYETILERGEALSRIIEDLLDLSHMESGRSIVLDKQPHIIEETVHHIVNQYQREAPDRQFEMRFNEQKSELIMDRGRIIQVLENLIGNAVKYTHKGGTIILEGWKEPDCYRINVIDDGMGMTSEQVSRIFEKFYRANPQLASVSGLGMGMSIVRNIIDAHNGQIEIESEIDQGTKVSIQLPLT